MKLSIVIPAFNPPEIFFKNIKIILNQKLKNIDFEIIVIDDCSKKKLYRYLPLKNKKIIYHRNKKNIGPGLARNIGITKSSGTHIMFLDSDDFVHKDLIKIIKLSINKNNSEVLFFNHTLIKNDKIINKSHKNKYFFSNYKVLCYLLSASIDPSAIFSVFKKNFLLKYKIFFKSGFHEDIYFMFKIFFYLKRKSYINKYLYIKINNKNSIINNINQKRIIDYFKALNSIYNFYLRNKKMKEKKRIKKFYLKGQAGYIHDLIIFIIKNEMNLNKSLNLMLYVYNTSKKCFQINLLPKMTKKEQVTNFFITNINNIKTKKDYVFFLKKIKKIIK